MTDCRTMSALQRRTLSLALITSKRWTVLIEVAAAAYRMQYC